MCYFVAIGASTEGWRLGCWIEDRLGEQVEANVPSSLLSAAFPSGDAVRSVTCSGCSCELVVSHDDQVLLRPAFRLALAFLVRRLGDVRLYVASSRDDAAKEPATLSMTIEQLLCLQTLIPAGVLVDVVAHAASRSE